MARTSQEIEQSIDTEASQYPELNELQSNSSMVAFWVHTKKVIVFVALFLEILFDKHKEEVNQIIDATETGSFDWYASIFKDYQHGDSLTLENNRPVYAEVDESKRIIKRVSITELPDASLLVKAVKEDNDELVPLTGAELAGFSAYVYRRKIAGTKIQIQSLVADELTIDCEAILDPVLFKSNGQLISDNSEKVKDVMEAHLKNFDFGNKFYLSKLIDEVMNIEGVIDFHINSTDLSGTTFDRSIISNAGHIKLNVNSTFTYVLS